MHLICLVDNNGIENNVRYQNLDFHSNNNQFFC